MFEIGSLIRYTVMQLSRGFSKNCISLIIEISRILFGYISSLSTVLNSLNCNFSDAVDAVNRVASVTNRCQSAKGSRRAARSYGNELCMCDAVRVHAVMHRRS